MEIREVLNGLSDEEIIQIVREFDNQTIAEDALIRTVTGKVFDVKTDKTTMNMMMIVISNASISLADRLEHYKRFSNTHTYQQL
jgi:hypothetical protein